MTTSRRGADPDQLRVLARSLRSGAQRVGAIGADIGRRARTSGWRGPDADRFGRDWDLHHRRALAQLDDRLRQLAVTLDRQAAEQLAVSDAADPLALLLPGGRGTVEPPRMPAPTAPPPLETRYGGGVDLRVGPVVTTLLGDLTVATLIDGRLRVTLERGVGIGAAGSLGGSAGISVGDETSGPAPVTGTLLDGRGRVAGLDRRSWEIPPEALPGLLTRLAAEQAAVSATGRRDPLGDLGSAIDALTRRTVAIDLGLGDRMGAVAGVPPTAQHERLVEFQASATAALALGLGAAGGSSGGPSGGRTLGGGRLSSTSTVRTGRAVRDGADHLVVETAGSGTASVTGALLGRLGIALPDTPHTSATARFELRTGPTATDAPDLVVRASLTSGDRLTEVTANVRLADTAAPSAQLRTALGELSRGDLDGAARSAAGASVPPDDVRAVVTHGEVDGSTLHGRASGGAATLGAGLAARGHVVSIRRGAGPA